MIISDKQGIYELPDKFFPEFRKFNTHIKIVNKASDLGIK